MQDPYRVLGVRRGAPEEEIRTAYRRRAKRIHPDTVPPARREEATRRFQQLQEAYALLSDPKLRMALELQRRTPWRPRWRRKKDEEEFVEAFFRNLLRGMMR